MYKFQHLLYNSLEAALRGVASAWIYGGMDRPYPETLDEEPASLAAECIKSWELGELLAQWGADAEALADAMARVLESARAAAC